MCRYRKGSAKAPARATEEAFKVVKEQFGG